MMSWKWNDYIIVLSMLWLWHPEFIKLIYLHYCTGVTPTSLSTGVTPTTLSTGVTPTTLSTGVTPTTLSTGVTPTSLSTGVTPTSLSTGVTPTTLSTGVTPTTLSTGVTPTTLSTGVTPTSLSIGSTVGIAVGVTGTIILLVGALVGVLLYCCIGKHRSQLKHESSSHELQQTDPENEVPATSGKEIELEGNMAYEPAQHWFAMYQLSLFCK